MIGVSKNKTDWGFERTEGLIILLFKKYVIARHVMSSITKDAMHNRVTVSVQKISYIVSNNSPVTLK